MDKRRQSILKADGRIPLQEAILPDFPEEDTATVTVTKSRRVSFGANLVKEYIVGSAVSTQFFSEYEQAVSSSDSSNQNTSRSGILDQSTFQGDDALNLCTKQSLQDEFSPLKKKFCPEKLNSYGELNDSNNENLWDFNVGISSNIFADKNVCYLNKADLSRNTVNNIKKVSHLSDSSMMDKQFQNKRNESELSNTKMDESLAKKAKMGKFSSTIFFSADSPTADVEFTEGCISLAKSIFDKKKKEMTVYIKGTPKDSKKEDARDGSNTVVFESDDSDVGMKLTKCMDGTENSTSPGNFSDYFPCPINTTESGDDFDESHENIENIPFHTYSLNVVLGRGENSRTDAELERSLFFPERSLTEMLCSEPLKTTESGNLLAEKDNTEECDMEISSPGMLKTTILDEGMQDKNEERGGTPIKVSSLIGCIPADEEENDCASPIFSKDGDVDDISLTSEDNAESALFTANTLKMSMCDDTSPIGNSDLDLSNCSPLKVTASSASDDFTISEQGLSEDGELISNPSLSSVEDLNCSASKDEYEDCHFAEDNKEEAGVTNLLKSADSDSMSSPNGGNGKPEPEGAQDVNNKNSLFRECNEGATVIGTPKSAAVDDFSSGDEGKEITQLNNGGKLPNERERDAFSFVAEIHASELKEKSSTKIENEMGQVDHFQTADVVRQNETLDALDVRFCESSFLNRSVPEEGDRISLGDRKILNLLSEQSEESNCRWTIDSMDHTEDINVWSFSIPILNCSAVMKFKLRPPKDKSLFSFSVVLDGSLELRESNEYQLEKHRIAVEYAFGKLKTYFQRENRELDNVHKLPIFLDKMNLIMKKMNDILGQVTRILKEYPGSQLEESVLSFRIYSFPLLFSYLITVDMSDPFQLSENSVRVKKQFGDFNTNRVKSMFGECLKKEEPLICYIAKLTESVVEMEREIGFITNRSHIRLVR